jgi:F-type H+-transporting ATPase subunit epsilon
MKNFKLEIVSPERLALSQEVSQVTVPSEDGEITILPDHILLFSTLTEGEVVIQANGEEQYLVIGGGFVEVTDEKVIILVSRAYKADELNEEAILKAKKEAEEAIERGVTGLELQSAQAFLRSTLVDLKVIRRRNKRRV